MRLRRLSRVEAPPHFCAPETSPLQPLAVRSHSWGDGPGSGPPQDGCELILLAPLDASLIQRAVTPSAPIHTTLQTKHPSPAIAKPGQFSLKLSCRATLCGIHLLPLGCMRERSSLSILLHQYWSRSPSLSLFLGPSACSTTDRHPCLLTGCYHPRGLYYLAIHICKPPSSPPTTDRIERAYHHLMTA
jgi:hypothetical protein